MNAGFWFFLGIMVAVVLFQTYVTESLSHFSENGGNRPIFIDSSGIGSGTIVLWCFWPIFLCLIGMGVSALVYYL